MFKKNRGSVGVPVGKSVVCVWRKSAFGRGESAGNFGPVHDIPECTNVVGAAILVVEIVGVFPDVEAEDGSATFGERGVLVWGAFDDECAISADAEPCPDAAEAGGSGFIELFPEVIEGTECGIDCGGEFASGFSATAGGEDGPKEGVVGMSATVIANDGADVFGDCVEIFDEVFNGFGCEWGAFEGGIDVVDVCLVVFGVMDFHGARIDMRFERVVGVGELGEGVGHRELRRNVTGWLGSSDCW